MLRLIFFTIILVITLPAFSQTEGWPSKRISYTLKQILSNKNFSDTIQINFSVSHSAQIDRVKTMFHLNQVAERVFTGKMVLRDLQKLIQDTSVLFINVVTAPKEELTTGINDLATNRINFAHHIFSSVKGDSINVSVKERLFDTADIDLKERVFKTGLENNFQTAHASLMATIIAGAANSSPFAKGVSYSSRLTSSSFNNLFPDPDSVYQKNKITVQNHSYGTVIENFYGNEAMAFDRSAITNPSLLFIFSSGNSGNQTTTEGPYANVPGFANLTGNFKQAKNVIIVGATDSFNVVQALGSKGPSYDGRIKPELVAFGEDGSSGAAALVSGTAALMQDAYKKWNNNQMPPSALIKAILINSAEDIDAPNVDYTSGFGSLNTFKALETIKNNFFYQDAATNGATKSFPIYIPSGISKFKVTLAWTDPEAAPNASKAVINDLDLVLRNMSTSQTWLPWVLNHFPDKDSLQLRAQRKTDTLNNVEQITLDNPAAGNYIIEVKGSRVAGSQNFSIAYQYDTTNIFYFSYPTAVDPLISGNTHVVRWKTTFTGGASLEYATNNNNWRVIAAIPDVTKEYHRWQLPDTVSIAQLRMVINSSHILSDTFAISPQLSMDVGFNCVDSFLLFWNKLPVTDYRLYQLGNRYLQPAMQLADTSVLLSNVQYPSAYYSVAPIISNREGIRSNTLNYVSQSNGCYIKSFFLQAQTIQSATLRAEVGSLYNVTEVALEKFDGTRFVAIQTIANPLNTVFNLNDVQLKQGENLYRFRVRLGNGTILYSTTELVYHFPSNLPVITYPNPVSQNGSINIINNESGRYTLLIVDESGRTVFRLLLTATLTKIPSHTLGKGLYIVRIQDRGGKSYSQKLVVY